ESPRNHARQVATQTFGATSPATDRLDTPTVAESPGPRIPPNTTRPTTSRNRSSSVRNPGIFRSAHAAKTASPVFPAAIARATGIGAPVHKLAKKAPRATAGQKRVPSRSSAASEIPLGGHTIVANELTAWKLRPIRAKRT